jgi:DNA-binding LacI/PurR family transcriptional regulator
MGVTIYDIAKEIGVSTATVSRVLSKKTDVMISSETRKRVLHAAEELGYRPNISARALTTGKSYNIALFVPSIHERLGPHIVRLLEAIEPKVSEMGYRLIICGELESISGKGHLDGLLMIGDPLDEEYQEPLKMLSEDLPCVSIWNSDKSAKKDLVG